MLFSRQLSFNNVLLLCVLCYFCLIFGQSHVRGVPTKDFDVDKQLILRKLQNEGKIFAYDTDYLRAREVWSTSKVAIFTILISGTAYVADKTCTVYFTTYAPAPGLACAASALVTAGLGIYGFISGVINGKRDQDIYKEVFFRGNETHTLAQVMHHETEHDKWIDIGRMVDYKQPNMWGKHYKNSITRLNTLRVYSNADSLLANRINKRQIDGDQHEDDGGGDVTDWVYGDENQANGSGMSGSKKQIAHILVQATNSWAKGDGMISQRNCANFVHPDGKERGEVGYVKFGDPDNQPGEEQGFFNECAQAD